MENASKALLIAAAVLIVILLIAFGMNIFNSAKDVGDASEASSAINTAVTGTSNKLQGLVPGEAREFNKQFEKYLGKDKDISIGIECIGFAVNKGVECEHNGNPTKKLSEYSKCDITCKYGNNGCINYVYVEGKD